MDIHFFIKLCMRYIVTAKSKSLFKYGIRTEKIFRPTQPGHFEGPEIRKIRTWSSSDVGVGLG